MDPLFVTRQPAPSPVASTIWPGVGMGGGPLQHADIEYHYTAPPPHTFTSPPTTPMTPGPLTPHHGPNRFPMGQLDHIPGSLVIYQNVQSDVPPILSHSTWPPEYRLFALCQELQHYAPQLGESESKAWWEQFMTDYFHEMAILAIEIDFGEGMQRYTLHRNFIAWYFKSILLENGISRYNLLLGDNVSHTYQQNLHRIQCVEAVQELDYVSPHQAKVCCQGQLAIDFTIEDKPRIIAWLFQVHNHVELIPRFCVHAASVDSTLSSNITCNGLPSATQSLLIQLNGVTNGIPEDRCTTNNTYTDHGAGNSTHWQQQPPPLIETSQQEQIIQDGSTVLSHPPLPLQHTNSLSLPPLHSTPSSGTSPIPTSPTLTKSINSNGSTCSTYSNSNQLSVSSLPPSSKSITKQPVFSSPLGIARIVMIATEPAYFSEDMIHGEDERLITRIDNQSKQTTPTPTSTPVGSINSETVTTPTHQPTNQNGSTSTEAVTNGSEWYMIPRKQR